MRICLLLIVFVLVVYSKEMNNNAEKLFQMKYRQIEEDDESANSQGDNSDEEIENNRRQSSQCEPCGAFRLPCCFPSLCQHRPPKISKCYKVKT